MKPFQVSRSSPAIAPSTRTVESSIKYIDGTSAVLWRKKRGRKSKKELAEMSAAAAAAAAARAAGTEALKFEPSAPRFEPSLSIDTRAWPASPSKESAQTEPIPESTSEVAKNPAKRGWNSDENQS